jgi:hypothetical protein
LGELRYEQKYFLSQAGYLLLRSRLELAAAKDRHVQTGGAYAIRSLYFDDYCQSALLDKIEGVERREKFRVRYYNHDPLALRLESKQKLGAMTRKLTAPLSYEQGWFLARGQIDCLRDAEHPLLRRFYAQARLRLLRPAVVVDYERVPFVFEDVRITFDRYLRSGRYGTGFLDLDLPTVPVLPPDRDILEVKFDRALPDTFRRILRSAPAQACAISKYQLCRAVQ